MNWFRFGLIVVKYELGVRSFHITCPTILVVGYHNQVLVILHYDYSKEGVQWYAGKRVAYIYKAKVKTNGSHYRCIWGKFIRPYGNSGVVRAKFTSNLPPKSMSVHVPKQHL
ncbi:hypothetical protein MKX03_035702, partial [Papaver bracteatum]